MLTTTRIDLAPDPRSPRYAREFVGHALNGHAPERGEIAELLVSELVTNAVLHAQTPIQVSVATADQAVRVEVADGSWTAPHLTAVGPEAATGRGLNLVEALADAWGIEPARHGKVVWFELR